jgi:PASTA domain-containing protein
MARFATEVGVDTAKRVEKLRKKYERELAASESRRVAYHTAVLELLERGGPEQLQSFAELDSFLTTRKETLVTHKPKRPRRRSLARPAAVLGALLLLVALTLGVLRVAQAPPFVPMVLMPPVMQLPERTAVQRLRAVGLNVRIHLYRRPVPTGLFHRVLGVSHQEGESLAKGSTVALYVVIPPKHS